MSWLAAFEVRMSVLNMICTSWQRWGEPLVLQVHRQLWTLCVTCCCFSAQVEPATYAIALKTFKDETSLSPDAALSKLRRLVNEALQVRAIWLINACLCAPQV